MDEEREVKGLVVSPNTGEITGEIHEGDKIIRKSSFKKNMEEIKVGEGENFIKMFESILDILIEVDLSVSQTKVLLAMIKYLRYESGLVAFPNGEPLYATHFSEILHIPERTIFKAIEVLVQYDIIAKNRRKNEIKYYVNPFIFLKGRIINKTLLSMFRKSKWISKHKSDYSKYAEEIKEIVE